MSADAAATADLLHLTQWLSPAFPVGGFAYSHGLDWWIGEGGLIDAVGVQDWLTAVLEHGAGRNDAILLALAHRGAVSDEELAELAAALAGSAERWRETLAQGRAFGDCHAALTGGAARVLPLPVAVGAAARALNLPTGTVAALYLHAFAGTLVSIAVRAVPLGASEGQRILQAVMPLTVDLGQQAAAAGAEDLGGAVPMADIAAMLHETQETRLFLS